MTWVVRIEDQNGTVLTQTFSSGHDAGRFVIAQIANARMKSRYYEAVVFIQD